MSHDQPPQVLQPSDQSGRDAVDVLASEHDHLLGLFARVSGEDEDRPAILKEIMQGLSNHLAMEKQVLVPVLKERVDQGPELADRLTDEHDRAEHILTLLERRKVNSPDVPELVTELMDLTQQHVAQADSTVLPALRNTLTPAELDQVGEAMVSDERRMLTHPHPSLPDSGPVAAVTRKLAEVVDRVRDNSADIGRTTT